MSVILRCEHSEPRRTTAEAPRPASFEGRLRRPPQDEGTQASLPRSRDAPSHPSLATPLQESPSCLPNKEGRRSAERRTTGSAPPQKKKACRRMRRAPSPLPANDAGSSGGALAFRRPTAALRRGTYLDSAPGRASWNHRIQTGGPSPAPVQPAPGRPAGRCPKPPGSGLQAPSGNRTRPIDRLSPVDVPSMREPGLGNDNGDECQELISNSVT
jgi:hypothetical protein